MNHHDFGVIAVAAAVVLLVTMSADANGQARAMNADAAVAGCAFQPPDSVHCGRTPTAAFDSTGRLWAAYVIGEFVHVANSVDGGKTWSRARRVNSEPEPVYTNGENRPKIAFGAGDEIFISWTRITPGRFAGDIRFSRSDDGGAGFEAPRTVNDDGLATSHRFETLFTDTRGRIYIAWLDKRDQVWTQERGGEYDGAALYYAVSTDNGVTFSANRKVADNSCECCRVAMSETLDGDVAVYWRHIFGDSIRDHAFAILGAKDIRLPARRPVADNWRIDACPHHGPAMVTGDAGDFHLAWFSLGDRKGIFYGRYTPETGSVDDLMPVAAQGAGHPSLARSGSELMLAWKQFDGENTQVMLLRSTDNGRHWMPEVAIAETSGASDHPLLVQYDGLNWLSWHTRDEGLRLVPLHERRDI